jgi:hypothetical protein
LTRPQQAGECGAAPLGAAAAAPAHTPVLVGVLPCCPMRRQRPGVRRACGKRRGRQRGCEQAVSLVPGRSTQYSWGAGSSMHVWPTAAIHPADKAAPAACARPRQCLACVVAGTGWRGRGDGCACRGHGSAALRAASTDGMGGRAWSTNRMSRRALKSAHVRDSRRAAGRGACAPPQHASNSQARRHRRLAGLRRAPRRGACDGRGPRRAAPARMQQRCVGTTQGEKPCQGWREAGS